MFSKNLPNDYLCIAVGQIEIQNILVAFVQVNRNANANLGMSVFCDI